MRDALIRMGIRRPEPRIARSREAVFRDVIVTPYEELLEVYRGASVHKGGPIWPDWERQVFPRMCKKGRPRDARPALPARLAEPIDQAAWGGPIVRHFGHQVADFAMRLVSTRAARPDLGITFATHRDETWTSLDDAPAFVADMLDWLDVPPERRILNTEPRIVRQLYVAEQAEQIGGPGPNDRHLDAMDELTRRQLGGMPPLTSAVAYVSRAAMPTGFAGDAYLEQRLREAGVTVMRPESLGVAEQIRRYHAAETLVFAEGSAIHGLQLTGRLRSDVIVLERRRGSHLARRNVQRRARSVRYVNGSRGIVHGILPSSEPALPRGISLLSAEAAVSVFRDLGFDLSRGWDDGRFAAAVDADVREWLRRQADRPGLRSRESDEHIVRRLHELGLANVAREATEILGRSRPRA